APLSCTSMTRWSLKLTAGCPCRPSVIRWAGRRPGQKACGFAPMAMRLIFTRKINEVTPMSINKFNSEGYYDPTTYEAITNIEKEERALRAFRPIVYICSPYAGDVTANIENARRYSRFAVDTGYIPIAPHLLFPQFLNDDNPKERQLGLFFGNALMGKGSEVWVFGSRISSGMETEIKRARWKSYRLRFFTENCEEVTDYA